MFTKRSKNLKSLSLLKTERKLKVKLLLLLLLPLPKEFQKTLLKDVLLPALNTPKDMIPHWAKEFQVLKPKMENIMVAISNLSI